MSRKDERQDGPNFKDQCRPVRRPQNAEDDNDGDDQREQQRAVLTSPSAQQQPPEPCPPRPGVGLPTFKDQVGDGQAPTAQHHAHHDNDGVSPLSATLDPPIIEADALVTTHNASDSAPKQPLILFVDDMVEAVAHILAYLRPRGYYCVHTTSTACALTLLQHGLRPDVIVSDMGRVEYCDGGRSAPSSLDPADWDDPQYNPTAGLLLVEEVRKLDSASACIPVIILTTFDNVQRYHDDVTRRGGNQIISDEKDGLVEALRNALPVASARVE